MHTQIKRPV